jgi:hypothetical protein
MAPVAGSLTSEEARWAGSEQSSASLRNATTTFAPSRSRPEEGSASAIFIGSMPCEELARVGERPQAGEPRVAGEARGPPVAVALRGRVLITGRPAGAEALVHAGAGDCYLIVHRRLQLVESGGEILQGGGETLLLSGHRIRVVDDQKDVRFRRNLDAAVLGHRHECRRLHRHGHVALAATEKDEHGSMNE